MNPIKYSDLIKPDTSISDLIQGLKDAENGLLSLTQTAKDNAKALKKALEAANPGNPAGQAQIADMAAQIDALKAKIDELNSKLAQNRATQQKANALDKTAIRQKIELKQAVRNLTNEVRQEIMSDQLSAEQIQKLSQLAEVQKMSYNQLAEAYGLLKAQINQMTGATANEVAAREKLAATARNVYEQMNTLQQATGKYQLQVGNYQKSWNGLNLAMQQVIREVPNAKMGFDMFFLAISNNLPILADQIKLAKDRYAADKAQIAQMRQAGASAEQLAAQQAKLVPVGKQILQSLFSWQTALMLGVTLLTLYGTKVVEWFKRVVIGTDEAKEAAKRYVATLSELSTKGGENIGTLRMLYSAVTDVNLAMNDRKDAMQSLLKLYPDAFSSYTQEELLTGKASKAYEKLANNLAKVAMARAAENKASEISGKMLESEMKIEQLRTQLTTANGIWETTKLRSRIKTASRELDGYKKDLEALKAVVADFDMFSFIGDGSAKGEKSITDHYWSGIEAIIKGMEEGLTKSLADLFVEFGKAKEKIKKEEDELLKIIKTGTKTQKAEAEKQLKNISVELAALSVNYEAGKNKLISDTINKYIGLDVEDEPDYEEQARKTIRTRLEIEKNIRDAELYKMYETGAVDSDQLKTLLNTSDQDFWRSLLDEFRKNGVMTVESYKEIMEKLVKSETKGEDKRPWWAQLLGVTDVQGAKKYISNLEEIMRTTLDCINEMIDAYKAEAEAARDAQEAQVDAAQTVYEAELEAYKNGYANNVEYARKELELEKEKLAEANETVAKYNRMQQQMNALTQMGNMIVASSNLFANASKMGIIGIPVAIAATTAMFAAFAATQVKARQLAKQGITFGDGMHEYLNYGGTHASGNDIDFGRDRYGRPRRVERGEMVAVFNARNTRRYGAGTLGALVDAVNHGTLESTYSQIFAGANGYNINVNADSPYAKGMADDISAIRKSSERRYVAGNGTIVERYRNRTRTKHLN